MITMLAAMGFGITDLKLDRGGDALDRVETGTKSVVLCRPLADTYAWNRGDFADCRWPL